MNKVLIIGPSWIGDAVMAQTLFKIIKQRDSSTIIHVLAPNWVIPILSFMPEVDRAIIWPFAHGEFNISKRYKFGKSLRKEHYTQAIVLPNSFKSALIPFWAKIPLRTGWHGEIRYGLLNDIRILNKTKFPLMVQIFAALAFNKAESLPKQLPLPQLIIKENFNNEIDKKFHFSDFTQPILALCPGGEYGKSKRWSPEYFAEISKKKLNEGWLVWLLGGKNDKSIADEIELLTQKKCTNFVGETTLDEAVVILSKARIVIANDTGLMHVAAALQKPLVAIYGATSPKFAPPLSKNARIVTANLKCSPCFKRSCPLKHNRYRCLTEIKPEMVLNTLDSLLAELKS